MAKNKIIVEEIWQKLKNIKYQLIDNFEPEQQKDFYVNNLFTRTFASLVGMANSGNKILVCNESGQLIVATTGAAYSNNSVKKGTAPDAYAGKTDFTQVVSRIDVKVWDESLMLKIWNTQTVVLNEMEFAPGFYSLDISCVGIDVENETVGNNARYEIVGWY